MNFIRKFLLLWVGSIEIGCAFRAVPRSFPEASPASRHAVEAKPASVTRALQEDPPLPGESTEQWPGLHPEAPKVDTGHDHHSHGASQPLFSCPMHEDVVSDHDGLCPKCGMELVRQP